jgi:hypothetical protein
MAKRNRITGIVVDTNNNPFTAVYTSFTSILHDNLFFKGPN